MNESDGVTPRDCATTIPTAGGGAGGGACADPVGLQAPSARPAASTARLRFANPIPRPHGPPQSYGRFLA